MVLLSYYFALNGISVLLPRNEVMLKLFYCKHNTHLFSYRFMSVLDYIQQHFSCVCLLYMFVMFWGFPCVSDCIKVTNKQRGVHLRAVPAGIRSLGVWLKMVSDFTDVWHSGFKFSLPVSQNERPAHMNRQRLWTSFEVTFLSLLRCYLEVYFL